MPVGVQLEDPNYSIFSQSPRRRDSSYRLPCHESISQKQETGDTVHLSVPGSILYMENHLRSGSRSIDQFFWSEEVEVSDNVSVVTSFPDRNPEPMGQTKCPLVH